MTPPRSGSALSRPSVARSVAVALMCATTPVTVPAQAAADNVTPRPPALKVEVVAKGLSHGWDLAFLPGGDVLLTERPGAFKIITPTTSPATPRPVKADLGDVFARGEGGLMGVALHPDFAASRLFTTCLNHKEQGRAHDVRLVTWRLSADGSSAERVKDLLTGLPTASGGRHSGCRLVFATDGTLVVGTGDTAVGRVPQDKTSLGGKTLRLDAVTGAPAADNPFVGAANPRERFVYTYGHRNVQGLAVRPGSGQIFSAEHGPDIDDEVNRIQAGANYGWDPSRGGTTTSYDESVPMTDKKRFPEAVEAVWSSGDHTEAVCGADFVQGARWGALDGTLAVTALKGVKTLFLRLDASGALQGVETPKELDGTHGRLRGIRRSPDGALYITTSNGNDDKLLRVTPAPA